MNLEAPDDPRRSRVSLLLENDYIVLSQQYFSLAYCCFGTFTLILAVTAENSSRHKPTEQSFQKSVPNAKDYCGVPITLIRNREYYPEHTFQGPRTLSQSQVAVIDPRWRRPAMRKFYPPSRLLRPPFLPSGQKKKNVKCKKSPDDSRNCQCVPNSYVGPTEVITSGCLARSPPSHRHGISILQCPNLSP